MIIIIISLLPSLWSSSPSPLSLESNYSHISYYILNTNSINYWYYIIISLSLLFPLPSNVKSGRQKSEHAPSIQRLFKSSKSTLYTHRVSKSVTTVICKNLFIQFIQHFYLSIQINRYSLLNVNEEQK